MHMQVPRKLVEVTVVVVAIIGTLFFFYSIASKAYTALAPETFRPISVERLNIQSSPVVYGTPVTINNGICNSSRYDRIIEVYEAVQQVVPDPIIQPNIVNLIGTASTGMKIVISPGCALEDAITQRLPAGVTPGRWRIFVQITTRDHDGKVQIVIATSDFFEVVDSGG